MIIINLDAAFDPAKKAAGLAFNVQKEGRQISAKFYIENIQDNHQAEFLSFYQALIWLEQSLEEKDTPVSFNTDSSILAQSFDKRYVKSTLYDSILQACFQISDQFSLLFLQWVPEGNNRAADALAKQALLKQGKVIQL